MSRLGDVSGTPERKRMWSTHGDARKNYGKKNENLYVHVGKKTVKSEKPERTSENKNEKKKYKTHEKNNTEPIYEKNADGDDAGERDGNRCVDWRSIRSAGNCDARRTSERWYGEHRARQEADARLQ